MWRDILIVALIGAGTLGMRALFMVGAVDLPARAEQWLTHAKPAILAALVGGFLAAGQQGLALASVAGVGVAWLLARRGMGMLTVLGAGMLTTLVIPG